MKTKIITIIAIAALIVLGCSKDDIKNDEYNNSIELRELADIQANSTDFVYKEVGEFEYQNPTVCGTKGQIYSIGFININTHGKFFTEYYQCTDYVYTNMLEAVYTDMEGDQLFGVSVDSWNSGENTLVFELYFQGGTGKYINAEGQVTLTNVLKLETAKAGSYSNVAKGTLSY